MTDPPQKKQRVPRYTIEISANDYPKEAMYDKIHTIRRHLEKNKPEKVTNGEILDLALSRFIDTNCIENETNNIDTNVFISKDKTEDEQLFITAKMSLEKCIEIANHHGQVCPRPLGIHKIIQRGHVVSTILRCRDHHRYRWSSSPYIEQSTNYLVNLRILHGFTMSGMLFSHYERFTSASGIGIVSYHRKEQFSVEYKKAINEEYQHSIEKACLAEMELKAGQPDKKVPIDILTDARHGWRKNAKDTTVVAIGDLTHKVIANEHVTRSDDPVAQRHELLGSKRIHDGFQNKDIQIGIWAHDFNASINKYVKDLPAPTINQNETWHAMKNVKNCVSKVANGPKYKHETVWHRELMDKVDPVSTHFQYAMRSCDKNPKKLIEKLDNIISHYENDHERCPNESRCRTDPNYQPSRELLTQDCSKDLLRKSIKETVVYKNPANFCHAKDTFYVESFNNTLLIFMDKRVAFGDAEYMARSQLGTLHWNENVDRGSTSVYRRHGRRQKKRNLVRPTYHYYGKVWECFVNRHLHNVFLD